ncbi:MAG: hypothetical protein ACYDAY_02295 [Candidatus Dormibacteria bacterium]
MLQVARGAVLAAMVMGAMAVPSVHASSTQTGTYVSNGVGAEAGVGISGNNIGSGGVGFSLAPTDTAVDSITVADAAAAALGGADALWQIDSATNPVTGTQTTLASGYVCDGVFNGPAAIPAGGVELFVIPSGPAASDLAACGGVGAGTTTAGTISVTLN